jgi:hypothetical protein
MTYLKLKQRLKCLFGLHEWEGTSFMNEQVLSIENAFIVVLNIGDG